MIIAQYLVEFTFYSFLGWVWESIYCTIKQKEWQDRGFLFGPVCPIYGTAVLVADIIFSYLPITASKELPVWVIFLICMIGSAIIEFVTSWVLEKRFHAMWWDYSRVPLNIQGRICLPVSISFGLAGVVIVKYLLPVMSGLHTTVHPLVYEGLALLFAALLGADLALTEASLSTLLQTMAEYKEEWNRRAEEAVQTIASTPQKLEEAVQSLASTPQKLEGGAQRAKDTIEEYFGSYKERLSRSQVRILKNIKQLKPKKGERPFESKISGQTPLESLKQLLKK